MVSFKRLRFLTPRPRGRFHPYSRRTEAKETGTPASPAPRSAKTPQTPQGAASIFPQSPVLRMQEERLEQQREKRTNNRLAELKASRQFLLPSPGDATDALSPPCFSMHSPDGSTRWAPAPVLRAPLVARPRNHVPVASVQPRIKTAPSKPVQLRKTQSTLSISPVGSPVNHDITDFEPLGKNYADLSFNPLSSTRICKNLLDALSTPRAEEDSNLSSADLSIYSASESSINFASDMVTTDQPSLLQNVASDAGKQPTEMPAADVSASSASEINLFDNLNLDLHTLQMLPNLAKLASTKEGECFLIESIMKSLAKKAEIPQSYDSCGSRSCYGSPACRGAGVSSSYFQGDCRHPDLRPPYSSSSSRPSCHSQVKSHQQSSCGCSSVQPSETSNLLLAEDKENCTPYFKLPTAPGTPYPQSSHGRSCTRTASRAGRRQSRKSSLRSLSPCCLWSEDRKRRMQQTKEILESTRLPDLEVNSGSVPCDLANIPSDLASDSMQSLQYCSSRSDMSPQDYNHVSQNDNLGQLKMAVYINSGLLTIHVGQARHLVAKDQPTCDTYVRVALIPDKEKLTHCKTAVVPDTNHPVFDEKFSFELLPEDLKKRVVISVWHQDLYSRSQSEFQGCMSFGINNIMNRSNVVNGWYHLLAEDMGRKKHLQVVCQRPVERHATDVMLGHAHHQQKRVAPITMKNQTVLVRRGTSGYGFTVTGGGPVQVCRVEQGGPGDKAGLRSGDYIMKINRERVSTASVECVARIIRHCSRKIVLEVQRPGTTETAGSTPWLPAHPALDSSMSSDDDDDDSFDSSLVEDAWRPQQENIPPPPPPPSKSKLKWGSLKKILSFKDFH